MAVGLLGAPSAACARDRREIAAPGGGAFLTLDSCVGAFAEVDCESARTRINDAFTLETVDCGR